MANSVSFRGAVVGDCKEPADGDFTGIGVTGGVCADASTHQKATTAAVVSPALRPNDGKCVFRMV